MFVRGMAASLALAVASAPAAAQHYSDGYTFLKAVKERDGPKVNELVSEPGTTVVNTREQGSGEAALHILTRGRDYTWLNFILARGARPDIQNARGETPLGIAAQIGWLEGAQLLLSRRAAVDFANSRGETPLILAVQRRDPAMVRLLLSRGANARKTDNAAGMSALDYAKQDPRAAPILRILETSVTNPANPAAGPKL